MLGEGTPRPLSLRQSRAEWAPPPVSLGLAPVQQPGHEPSATGAHGERGRGRPREQDKTPRVTLVTGKLSVPQTLSSKRRGHAARQGTWALAKAKHTALTSRGWGDLVPGPLLSLPHGPALD